MSFAGYSRNNNNNNNIRNKAIHTYIDMNIELGCGKLINYRHVVTSLTRARMQILFQFLHAQK